MINIFRSFLIFLVAFSVLVLASDLEGGRSAGQSTGLRRRRTPNGSDAVTKKFDFPERDLEDNKGKAVSIYKDPVRMRIERNAHAIGIVLFTFGVLSTAFYYWRYFIDSLDDLDDLQEDWLKTESAW